MRAAGLYTFCKWRFVVPRQWKQTLYLGQGYRATLDHRLMRRIILVEWRASALCVLFSARSPPRQGVQGAELCARFRDTRQGARAPKLRGPSPFEPFPSSVRRPAPRFKTPFVSPLLETPPILRGHDEIRFHRDFST